MKNKIILITKDVLRADYLAPYGNEFWETPNITELAKKGTIFYNHYTAAPSSAMAYSAMFSGLFPHQMNRKKYDKVKPFNQCKTLFSLLQEKNYSCNVIWDEVWFKTSYLHSKVYGDATTKFYNLKISQHVGPHHKGIEEANDTLSNVAVGSIIDSVKEALEKDKTFIWLHLPHVILGRTSYGSDIDLLDNIIGRIRDLLDDNSIYISADHGHMNLDKGIPVYGFHVYQGAIKIPLITPKINNQSIINFPTSNVQLKDIILNNKVEKLPYIFSDSQYYLQENRKLAIIKDNYKYIYNKINKTEELYDLDFDPNENVNLLIDKYYDRNRYGYYNLSEIYYYPYWDKVEAIYTELKAEKNRIWKEGTFWEETAYKLNNFRKKGKKNFSNIINSKKITRGNFGATIKNRYYEI